MGPGCRLPARPALHSRTPRHRRRREPRQRPCLGMSGSIGVGRVGIVGLFGCGGGGVIAGGNGCGNGGMGTGYGVRGTGYGARGAASAATTGAVATAAAATHGGGGGGCGGDGDGEGSGSVGGVGGVGGSGGFPWRLGLARATAAAARASTSSSSAAVELAAASGRRWRRRRRAGGEGPQREAEIPQQEGRTPLPRGPDTRNRTSNPDSWVLPGRTTIGGEARSPRARPRHPMGSRGKLRPSGQPREGRQKAARGRRPTLLTRGLWRSSCRIREGPQE